MSDLTRLRVVVYGKVQGVYYRAFTARQARALSLKGYVKNLPGGQVELEAEGDRKMLESLLQSLKYGPPGASVEKIDVSWSEFNGSYKCFDVRY